MFLDGNLLYVRLLCASAYDSLLLTLVLSQGTRGVYTLKLSDKGLQNAAASNWAFSHTGEIVQTPLIGVRPSQASPVSAAVVPTVRARLCASLSFEDVVAQGQPVILEGLETGDCTARWSLDYLASRIGKDRKVRPDGGPLGSKHPRKCTNHDEARWSCTMLP